MSRKQSVAALVLIVLAALNLRPAVTTLGPLLPDVRAALGMGGTVAGLLTALPPLCFAVFGLLAPALARRTGLVAAITLGMAAITAGLLARAAVPGAALFLLCSGVALGGIAVANVLMPALISRAFPGRVGPVTGVYSMALTGGAALGAALTVPVTGALGGGWRAGLAVWAVLAAAAALWALPRRASFPAPAGVGRPRAGMHRSATARALAVFFATVATAAYTVMGWLPQIYQDAGLSAGASGVLTAISMGVGVPASLVMPSLAGRRPDQRTLVAALTGCGLVAYAGLALVPATLPLLWAVLVGLSGATFPLALTMLGLRARTPDGVARLSSFAQSFGYLMSIPGPILVGALYQHTGGWHVPLALLALLLVPQLLAGLRAALPRRFEDDLTPRDPVAAKL